MKYGINSVKKNSSEDARHERKQSKDGKFQFNLKASNGQIIGTCELYETEASREKGIESVKKNGSTDSIVEE